MKRGSMLSWAFSYSLASWIGALINLVTIPISTYLYDPTQLGKINFFFSTALIFVNALQLGLDQGYLRFYSEVQSEVTRKSMLSFCISISMAACVLLFLTAMPFSDYISSLFFNEEIALTLLYLLTIVTVLILLRLFSLLHRANGNIINYTVIAVSYSLVSKGMYIPSALIRKDASTAIAFVCIVGAVITLITICLNRKEMRAINLQHNRALYGNLVKFSLPLMPALLMSVLNINIPQIVLRMKSGFSDVGLFGTAVSMASVMSVIQSGFNAFWPPYVFEHYRTERVKIQKVHIWVTITMTLFAMGIVMFQDVAFLLIAPQYREARTLFPFLLLTPLCYTIGETTGIGISIEKKSKFILYIYSISALLNFVLCFVGVNLLGLQGAAIAAAISAVIALAAKTYIGERYYKSVPSAKYMVVSISMFFIVSITGAMIQNWGLRLLVLSLEIALTCILFGVSEIKSLVVYVMKNGRSQFRTKNSTKVHNN